MQGDPTTELSSQNGEKTIKTEVFRHVNFGPKIHFGPILRASEVFRQRFSPADLEINFGRPNSRDAELIRKYRINLENSELIRKFRI